MSRNGSTSRIRNSYGTISIFGHKYHLPHQSSNSRPAFIDKLEKKRQSLSQRTPAVKAITAYYDLVSGGSAGLSETVDPVRQRHRRDKAYPKQVPRAQSPPPVTTPPTGFLEPPVVSEVSGSAVPENKGQGGQSWQREYSRLADEIRVRHYSPKTLRSYRSYVVKFQVFTKSKAPESLTTDDVKTFLTHLAVNRKVAAATQNLAFNALLFFFRHVLGKEFGVVDGVVRAKKRPFIPVVLARDEIEEILRHLEAPYDLIVKLLYGCGFLNVWSLGYTA